MGFRRHRETDLERALRAQRPQPREQFVEMVSRKSGTTTKPRLGAAPGRFAPRIALVASVTVVLSASLGVAGALGHASNSVESFGKSVYHAAQTPSTIHVDGNDHHSGNGDPGGYDHDPNGHLPIHREYHHFRPICFHLHITFVPEFLYTALINFGQTPQGAGTFTAPTGYHPLRCR